MINNEQFSTIPQSTYHYPTKQQLEINGKKPMKNSLARTFGTTAYDHFMRPNRRNLRQLTVDSPIAGRQQ